MDYPSRSFHDTTTTCYPRLASFCEGGSGFSSTCTPHLDYVQRHPSLSTSSDNHNSVELVATTPRTKTIRIPEILQVETATKPSDLFYRPLFLADSQPHFPSDFQPHPVYRSVPSDTTSVNDARLALSSGSTGVDDSSVVKREQCTSFLDLRDILDDSVLGEVDFIADMEEALSEPVNDLFIQRPSSGFPIYSNSGSLMSLELAEGCSWGDYTTDKRPIPAVKSDVLLVDAVHDNTDVLHFAPRANTFDLMDDEKAVFVRPQDVMGEKPLPIEDILIKSERHDTMDIDHTELIYPEAPANEMDNIRHSDSEDQEMPKLTSEQLCEVVDYFFQHIHIPKSEEHEDQTLLSMPQPSLQVREIPIIYHSRANADSTAMHGVERINVPTRMVFADKTNSSRTKPIHSVLEDFDDILPVDINLDKSYEGVSEQLVAQKTKYFRMMNPGARLSDDLIFNFAGRLSASGEPILGYRCYITGCGKTTKRKDHMGDHIRTHLGEKPFTCSICGLGFIRNNDCQRHENNHRPDKKFICECQAAFSRRDLFVRHQKTACQLSGRKVYSMRRPRQKARQSTPDSDAPDDFDYVPGSSILSWKRC